MSAKKTIVSAAATMAILWIGHFLVDIMLGYWTIYKTLAKIDLALAGAIAAICPFIGEAMQLFFGSLGDRGYRKALLLFGIATTTASALLPLSQQAIFLFIVYLLTCLGSGAFHPTAVAVATSLTQTRRGLYVTIFASGGALGMAISQILFTAIYRDFNGHAIFSALPAFALVAFLYFVDLPGALHVPAPPGRHYGFSAMKKLFKCRELVTLYCTQVCSQAIYWGTMFFLPDVLQSKGYNPWICYGVGHLFFVLGAASMMIPGGHLSDKYSPKSILLLSSIAGIILYYTFLLSPVLPDAYILPLLFCLGASLGASHPVAVAFGNKMMPSRPGLVSAFLMGLVWCVSESLGPGGGGLLTKCFTEDAPTKALSVFGIVFIVGMAITTLLPDKVTEEIQLENV